MTNFGPRCPALHPDLPYSRCWRDDGHSGAHRNVSGDGWGEPVDYADGGVTAAAVEQESECECPTHRVPWMTAAKNWERRAKAAEDREIQWITRTNDARAMAALWKEAARRAIQAPVTLARWEKDLLVEDFKSNGPVYTTGERDRHRAQIERAEQERDDARHDVSAYRSALSRVCAALGIADDASTDDMVDKAECHDCIRDAAVIEKTRPVTVTDEIVERLRDKWMELRGDLPAFAFARSLLTAALTPEPQRPEGLTALIEAIRTATYDPEPVATGEALYNAGVRVTTEEGEHTPACEGGPGLPCDTCGSYWAGDTEEES